MNTIRVAILGAGGIATRHAKAWQEDPRTELVGAIDLVPERASRVVDAFGGVAAGSLEELLAKTPVDLVDVCTREHHHAASAIPVVERGIPVICEKIMAHSMDAGLAMVRTARTAGSFAAMQYNYRAMPGIARMREAAHSGEFGPLRQLTVIAVRNCFNHLLDSALDIVGEPLAVVARGRGSEAEQQRLVEGNIAYQPQRDFSCIIETNGPTLSMQCASTHHNDLPFAITACFEEATLQLTGLSWPANLLGELRRLPDPGNLLDEGRFPDTGDQAMSFTPALAENINRLCAGQDPWSSWEMGWTNMLVSHACMQSIAENRIIDMAGLRAEMEFRAEVIL